MANRDVPVNGKQSELSLRRDGNLVLIDAGRTVIWSTKTKSTSSSSLQLQLLNTGNLVLDVGGQTLWQSFDYPTDTLLPNQPFTKSTKLVSSKSRSNYSSGFYKMFFDSDGILRLIYDAPETTTIYWPHPSFRSWEVGRLQYMYSRRAILDSNGQFNSSDGWKFKSADFGMGRQRIMRIDVDGNARVYSLVEHERRMKWEVEWQAISQPCKIHGTCGPNSLCTYSQDSGRKCSCLSGYKMVNYEDSSYGCEPEFKPCIQDDCDFIELRHVEFYGYDVRIHGNYTVDACKKDCLQDNTCIGFQFGWKEDSGFFYCCIKTSLQNGYEMGYEYSMYIKLPKRLVSSFKQKTVSQSSLNCPPPMLTTITRSYEENNDIKPLGFMLVFGCVIGFIEIVCIVVFWYFSSERSSTTEQIYIPAATAFRKFTYSELKKASCNFSEEIGRGGACVVYKGRLSDNRVAAIKRLKNTNHHGEAEFQAEISTIGRVNHMNLIETWGYCAEGKHRLVVYEYMENGSLAKNLGIGKLDWATRLGIATGTAKGLAYLHEECLEWVLHCDVKPHNILLDANYNPKVADFGLSRLFDRSGINQSDFSMIRGTRGYMAPEWVFNLPITSKVDVFSYGVVILEMITGRSPAGKHHSNNENGEVEVELGLIEWVKSMIQESDQSRTECWVEKIVDPSISGNYNRTTMENLVRTAVQCAEEDREARPSMSQVVSMLLHA
ncbi:Apple-like protein [Cynara cardunculus var. scolymus]|uniref:Receptor-like serine/threonine-protein kinase n=2 Tax=Cynara cardunculus var. scolymus TaxID=59895 RepID=A0A103Y6C0_CYNCS|nr:Apple-like protein [Cynara cardunculus var. scolymus]